MTTVSTTEPVSVADAIRFLKRRKLLSLSDTNDLLTRTRNCLMMLQAFRELFPDAYPQSIKGMKLRPGTLTDALTDPESELLKAVHDQLFPIDTEAFEEWVLNGNGEIRIQVEPYGMTVTCEDVAEACYEGEDPFTGSLNTFLMLLLYNGFGEETWEWADAFYYWNVPAPLSMFKQVDEVDWDALYEILDEAGLGCVKAAMDIVAHCTGNIFLDYNPYDEQSYINDMQDFTVEVLKDLARQWIEAKPLMDDWDKAQTLGDNDPTIYPKIKEIWEQCCTYKETNKYG